MRVRMILDVPEDDCALCEHSYIFDCRVGRECLAFGNSIPLEETPEGTFLRCPACVAATVPDEAPNPTSQEIMANNGILAINFIENMISERSKHKHNFLDTLDELIGRWIEQNAG